MDTQRELRSPSYPQHDPTSVEGTAGPCSESHSFPDKLDSGKFASKRMLGQSDPSG